MRIELVAVCSVCKRSVRLVGDDGTADENGVSLVPDPLAMDVYGDKTPRLVCWRCWMQLSEDV